MAHSAGSGDRLARGATRAIYTVRDEVSVTDEKWNEMFGDFDPKKFQESKPNDPNAVKANSNGGFAETADVEDSGGTIG